MQAKIRVSKFSNPQSFLSPVTTTSSSVTRLLAVTDADSFMFDIFSNEPCRLWTSKAKDKPYESATGNPIGNFCFYKKRIWHSRPQCFFGAAKIKPNMFPCTIHPVFLAEQTILQGQIMEGAGLSCATRYPQHTPIKWPIAWFYSVHAKCKKKIDTTDRFCYSTFSQYLEQQCCTEHESSHFIVLKQSMPCLNAASDGNHTHT